MLACQCFHVLAQSLITYESWAFWSKKLLKHLSHSIATMGTNPTTSNFKFTPKHITFHPINIWHNYPFSFICCFGCDKLLIKIIWKGKNIWGPLWLVKLIIMITHWTTNIVAVLLFYTFNLAMLLTNNNDHLSIQYHLLSNKLHT